MALSARFLYAEGKLASALRGDRLRVMILAVMFSATEGWARLIGWLITEILFSRAGLWLLLSGICGVGTYYGGRAFDTAGGGSGLLAWILGAAGLIGALFLFHWLLNIGAYQRFEGDMTVAELEDDAGLSLHERFLRRGR
ncbi:hypothetical protein IT575_07015 [bacterium]|nr:hypothetical protein [bacterium]